MTQEQWQQIKQIFGDALEREPSEREAFIRDAARGDDSLLAELLRLLKESERESGLLSRPALAQASAVSQDEAPRFAPSTLLARRFRIVRFIARGGMGEVYEAEDLELGERVALKAIRRPVAADRALRGLFKREIQMARHVTHPNVCRIFDLVQHGDAENGDPALLLSMELIEGQTLADYVRLKGPLTMRGALPLIEEIAAGLQAVHDAGIVHGDLKPGNVMLVTRPGETAPHAVVMDFGMAFPAEQGGDTPFGRNAGSGPERAFESGEETTQACSSPILRGGTPDYFAPEQMQGAPPSTATDIYAFALLIEAMMGVPREKRLEPEGDRMPARWARIVRRCLASDPARRYRRPADVAKALRASAERRNTRRAAAALVCAAVLGLLAAKRIDMIRGTANRLLLTETRDLSIQAVSPDGKYLAATSWDTGDLLLREIGTGKSRRLTHKSTTWESQFGGTYDAIFSPDGRQIAYQWANSRFDGELRLIGTDGKGERTLHHDPELTPSTLDWSPDGSRLLIRLTDHEGKPRRLALISVAEGALQLLDKPPAEAHAVFGADASSLIFDAKSADGQVSEIHRLLLSGGESTLVGRTGSNWIAGWSPDRRRLLFMSDRTGQTGLWAVPVSERGTEGEARELVPNAKGWESISISRAGSLFYRHDASKWDVYTAVLDLAAGRTVSLPQRVTERFIGSYMTPNWSEDGRQLVFDSRRAETPELVIYEPGTGRTREIRPDLTWLMRPQWVEHDSAIEVSGRSRDGQTGHFRIDPRTGNAVLFRSAKDLESIFEGVWSRDGKIHFNRFQDFRRGIYRLNAETGERRVIYLPPPGIGIGLENLALAPDGRTLAFHAHNEAARSGTLMLIPAEGGEARPLLVVRSPESFKYGSFTWTPDSRRILVSRTRPAGGSPSDEMLSEIWQVPVDGGAPTKIDFPAMAVSCLRLNPDGKTIAFQTLHWKSEIWTLQNFL